MRPVPSYEEAVSRLEARGLGIKPGLERMEQLVRLMDNPQLTYPTIHIAGTNGKTSTARMLGAILAAHGLKTGVYTSPHLETIRERFLLSGVADGRVVSDLISEEELAAILAYVSPYVEMIEGQQDPERDLSDPSIVTYFELTTLAAFEWMAEKSVSVGIFEAGLGGRWDATNVIEAGVAILSSIGVDHAEFLGETAYDNAQEKVGIIKMGSSVVSAPQLPEVANLIERSAAASDAKLSTLGRDFRIERDETAVAGRLVTISTQHDVYRDLHLPLYGPFQAENLALAVAGAEALREGPLDDTALRAALESLTIPGRFEIIRRKPLAVVDGAHNPSAAEALARALRESFASLSITMVVSILGDKDATGVLQNLAPLAKRLILTRSSSPRGAPPETLASLLPAGSPEPLIIEPLSKAVDEAIAKTPEDEMVLVTGSLYGVGEARAHLRYP